MSLARTVIPLIASLFIGACDETPRTVLAPDRIEAPLDLAVVVPTLSPELLSAPEFHRTESSDPAVLPAAVSAGSGEDAPEIETFSTNAGVIWNDYTDLQFWPACWKRGASTTTEETRDRSPSPPRSGTEAHFSWSGQVTKSRATCT